MSFQMTVDQGLNDRLTKVVNEREQMRRNGIEFRVGPDGLIQARPRKMRRRSALAGIVLVALLFVGFKSMYFAQLGSDTYDQKIEVMQAGSSLDQIGAFLMQPDPVTTAISVYLRDALN